MNRVITGWLPSGTLAWRSRGGRPCWLRSRRARSRAVRPIATGRSAKTTPPIRPKSTKASAPPWRSSSTRPARCRSARPATRGPSTTSRSEALEAMLDATDAFVARRPDFPIKIGIYSFSSSVSHAAADPALRPRRRPRRARSGCRAPAAARRSARRCARRGPTSTAPASSASTCWSSPTARTRTAAAPDDVARDIFRKSEGAVQIYFVAFDTSPEKFAFLKEVGGDVIGAGSGAELRHGARRHLPGQDPRRGDRRRRAGTGQEVTRRRTRLKGESRDSSQVLVCVRRADQQGRQRVLGGRPDRPDALRVRPGGRAAQGRARRARAVPRPGRARHAPGRRPTSRTCRSSRPRPRPT